MSGGAGVGLAEVRAAAARPGNGNCFECDQRGPTYVDVTVGCFVCSRCSGLLRGLTPPHRVKSISMATFTPEEMVFIKSRGNDYCRSIWMALFEGEQPKFKDEQGLKDFLSDKYEKKRYYLDTNKPKPVVEPVPVRQNSTPTENSIWTNVITKQPVQNTTFEGFTSLKANTTPSQQAAIKQFNDNSSTSRFPVDFSNAEIYNSNQINNNLTATTTFAQNSFAAFDKINTNVVSPDRYAALADLDFSFRQLNQSQTKDDSAKPTAFNPFSNASRNPFCTNVQTSNGNSNNYPNPFLKDPSIAPTGQSKNPFL